MFRNLRAFRLLESWPETEDELAARLATVPFTGCASTASRAAGWESPWPTDPLNDDQPLLLRSMGADLLQLRIQTRLLPPAAINEALEERVAQFVQRTQRPPGRAERKELKDAVAAQLLPQALLKSDRVRVLCLPKDRLLFVDTATAATAELVTERLRDALGSLPIVPLEFKQPIATWLEQVFFGRGPVEFQVTRECRMQEAGDAGANVTWMDIDLQDGSVQRHVKQGLVLERLGLVFDSELQFVLDRDGVIRKLRLVDQAMEDRDVQAEASAVARLDADLALWSALIAKLFRALKRQLAGFAKAGG
ncbi:MAG: recombination-associated protein RdgC [Pseudomonadota bacterium]